MVNGYITAGALSAVSHVVVEQERCQRLLKQEEWRAYVEIRCRRLENAMSTDITDWEPSNVQRVWESAMIGVAQWRIVAEKLQERGSPDREIDVWAQKLIAYCRRLHSWTCINDLGCEIRRLIEDLHAGRPQAIMDLPGERSRLEEMELCDTTLPAHVPYIRHLREHLVERDQFRANGERAAEAAAFDDDLPPLHRYHPGTIFDQFNGDEAVWMSDVRSETQRLSALLEQAIADGGIPAFRAVQEITMAEVRQE